MHLIKLIHFSNENQKLFHMKIQVMIRIAASLLGYPQLFRLTG